MFCSWKHLPQTWGFLTPWGLKDSNPLTSVVSEFLTLWPRLNDKLMSLNFRMPSASIENWLKCEFWGSMWVYMIMCICVCSHGRLPDSLQKSILYLFNETYWLLSFMGSKQYRNLHTFLCFYKNIHKYGEMLVSWLGGMLAYWMSCIRGKNPRQRLYKSKRSCLVSHHHERRC